MTDTTTPPAIDYAREHADRSWHLFAREKNLTDTRPEWQETVTPDGSPLLSGQIAGRRPVWALARFARDYWLVLKPEDLRPQFDISVPGRTVLVWRFDGVWVELWHPDSAVDVREAPEVVLSVPVPSEAVEAAPVTDPVLAETRAGFLRGPGGRLRFTRKHTSPKETSTP
jgi:hypothetical protein